MNEPRVTLSDITPDTKISILIEYIKDTFKDAAPREQLTEFEYGKIAGRAEVFDMIIGISKKRG